MAFLRRKPWDELLPDGRSVYEAVRNLSRNPQDDQPDQSVTPDRMSGVASSPILTRNNVDNVTATLQPPVVPLERTTIRPFPDVSTPLTPPVSEPMPVTPTSPALAPIGAPPVMMLDRGGHAISATGGNDQLAADRMLLNRQQSEIPQRESKKMIALRTGLGLLLGGAPGAARTLIGDLSDRRALDRGRIDQNIARTQGQIGQEVLLRRDANQQLNDQARRNLEDAQAQRALREPLTRDPGFTLGEGQIRYDAAGNMIATRPGKPISEKPPERNVVNGALVERQADGTWKPVYESPAKPDTAGFTNEQLTKNISEAATEQAKVEQALRDTAPTISKPSLYAGEPPTVERNPIYADLENRRDKLIDDQRRWRGEMKAPTRGDRRGAAPTTHGFSLSGWLSKNPGKTETDAKAFHDNDPKYRAYQVIP